MAHRHTLSRALVRAVILFLLPAAASASPLIAADKVGGPESCAECHLEEVSAWRRTKHAKTFSTMERRPETAEILTKLGLGRIKTERSCAECHFLPQEIAGERSIASGISCESCHGAGADWVKVHGDYGRGATKETETPEHRAERWAQSETAGMIRPSNLYVLGATCYGCHIVTDEKQVNVGGHSAGSPGFNLLAWSQGEVRHTIFHTGNKANPEATREHQRRLFVIGTILEVEFCFRAVSRATERATFGLTLARRADAARKQLAQIQALAPTPELAAVVAVAQATALRLNNAAELAAAADQVAGLGRAFAARVTGEQLAGIDALLPGRDQFKGQPYEVVTAGP